MAKTREKAHTEESKVATKKHGAQQKARKRMDYDQEEFVHGESTLFRNDFTINTRCARVRVEVPRGKEGLMVIRFWPSLDPEHPDRLEKGRIGPHPFKGHGGWLQPVSAISMIGIEKDDKHTFLLYPPDAPKEVKDQNPVNILTRMCAVACDQGKFSSGGKWNSEWNKLMKGSAKGGGACIPKPGPLWFGLGSVYVNGEKDYFEDREHPRGEDPGDELTIIRLPTGTGRTIMELFAEEKREFDGDEEKTPSLKFVHGDPVGIPKHQEGIVKGGWFFTLWNPKNFRHKPTGPTSWTGKKKDFQGYEVELSRKFEHNGETYASSLSEEQVKLIVERSRFWFPSSEGENDGLLAFPPVEQQCLYLARALRKVPKLYLLAMADHPEYVTDEVKAIFAERASVVKPGLEGEDEYEEEDEDSPRAKKKTKKGRKDPIVEEPDEDEDEELEEEPDEDEDEAGEDDEDEFEDSDDEDADEDADDEDSDDEDADEDSDDEDSDDEDSDDEDSDDEDEDEDEDDEDAGEYFDDKEDDEDSDDEDSDDEGDDEDEDEDEGSDEDQDASAEFDPDEESSAKEKSVKDKMKKSLDKAKGRADKRSSTTKAEPPAAPKAKGKAPAKAKGKEKPAPAAEKAKKPAPKVDKAKTTAKADKPKTGKAKAKK